MSKYDEINQEWDIIEDKIKGKIARLGNGKLFLTRSVITTVLKMIRSRMPDEVKQEVSEKRLYHFTSEESAKKILETGYIRTASTSLTSYIGSYGAPAVNAFIGLPLIDDLLKNFSGDLKKNIGANVFLKPNVVLDAIEIAPHVSEMNGWMYRPLSDSAAIIEGAYLLPIDRTRHVKIGMDLERDEEGKPIYDYEKKQYRIISRVLTEKDFDENGEYKPPQDYLDIVTQMSKELGFEMNEDGSLKNNRVNHLRIGTRFESDVYKRQIKRNLFSFLKSKLTRTPRLMESRHEMIKRTLHESAFNTTNPHKKVNYVTSYAGKIMVEDGIYQESAEQLLYEINSSEVGEFLKRKLDTMDLSMIPPQGLHGLRHCNNVAMLALRIAQKQGILENDTSDRLKDLITTAAYYHDLGRVRFGVAWDYGRHAKRSVRKISKMDLSFLDGTRYSERDRNLLYLMIEGHETKTDDAFTELAQKYNISEQDMKIAQQLFAIIKDADALHRVRLDFGKNVNLNFNYLRSGEAKSLIFAAYEMHSLSKKISSLQFEDLLEYGTEEQKQVGRITDRKAFVESLSVSIMKNDFTRGKNSDVQKRDTQVEEDYTK